MKPNNKMQPLTIKDAQGKVLHTFNTRAEYRRFLELETEHAKQERTAKLNTTSSDQCHSVREAGMQPQSVPCVLEMAKGVG